MPMMTQQILKSVDLTKTQKSRYLEKETLFLQIQIKGYFMAKNSFVVEITFKKWWSIQVDGKTDNLIDFLNLS